mgnify:FL=1
MVHRPITEIIWVFLSVLLELGVDLAIIIKVIGR